jgi:hypothetical protein
MLKALVDESFSLRQILTDLLQLLAGTLIVALHQPQ